MSEFEPWKIWAIGGICSIGIVGAASAKVQTSGIPPSGLVLTSAYVSSTESLSTNGTATAGASADASSGGEYSSIPSPFRPRTHPQVILNRIFSLAPRINLSESGVEGYGITAADSEVAESANEGIEADDTISTEVSSETLTLNTYTEANSSELASYVDQSITAYNPQINQLSYTNDVQAINGLVSFDPPTMVTLDRGDVATTWGESNGDSINISNQIELIAEIDGRFDVGLMKDSKLDTKSLQLAMISNGEYNGPVDSVSAGNEYGIGLASANNPYGNYRNTSLNDPSSMAASATGSQLNFALSQGRGNSVAANAAESNAILQMAMAAQARSKPAAAQYFYQSQVAAQQAYQQQAYQQQAYQGQANQTDLYFGRTSGQSQVEYEQINQAPAEQVLSGNQSAQGLENISRYNTNYYTKYR